MSDSADFGPGVVPVNVQSADGVITYGGCTLPFEGHPDTCTVHVYGGTTVVATLDESTLPEGVGVAVNPMTYDVPAEKTMVGDIAFELVPLDDGEPEPTMVPTQSPDESDDTPPVTDLPSTGSGAGLGHGVAFAIAGTLSLILGVASVALLHRRTTHG